MATGNVLEARLAALESLLMRLLVRHPDYLAELIAQGNLSPAQSGDIRGAAESTSQAALSKLTQNFDNLTRSLIEERDHTKRRLTALEQAARREGAYAEMLALISEQDAFADIPMNRVLPLSIYLKFGQSFQMQSSAPQLLYAIGFDIFFDPGGKPGSWFDRLFGRSEDPITRNEVYERLRKLERALELKGIEAPQAQVDERLANAASTILKGLENEQEAAVVLGSLCVLKKDNRVAITSLSQEQVLAIRKNPQLLRSPIGLQELVFGPATQSPQSGKTAAIEKRTRGRDKRKR